MAPAGEMYVLCEHSHWVLRRRKEGQVRAGEQDQLEGSSSKKWLAVHTTRFPGLWVALDCSDRDTNLRFLGPKIRALRQKPHPENVLKIGISRKRPQVGFGRMISYLPNSGL